jgi:hypothetical protein
MAQAYEWEGKEQALLQCPEAKPQVHQNGQQNLQIFNVKPDTN